MDTGDFQALVFCLTELLYPVSGYIGELTVQAIIGESIRLFEEEEEDEEPDVQLDEDAIQAVLDMWQHPRRDAAWTIYKNLDSECEIEDRCKTAIEIVNSEDPAATLRTKIVSMQDVVEERADAWMWSLPDSWSEDPEGWKQMQSDTCDKVALLCA